MDYLSLIKLSIENNVTITAHENKVEFLKCLEEDFGVTELDCRKAPANWEIRGIYQGKEFSIIVDQ